MRKLNNNELNRITVEEYKNAKKTPIVIVLDNVRSAHNVGAIFRTSDAFLIEKIFLCGITPCPPNNEIRKSALGSTNSVDWAYESDTNNILNNLKKSGYRIVGVEQVENSTKLSNFEPKQPTALIFGHEIDGINQKVINSCDEFIEITQLGTKHSLNISVCAGIVIYKAIQSLK